MPFPGNSNMLLAQGITPVTAALTTLLAGGSALILAHPHFRKIREPHHFDTLDDECVELLSEVSGEEIDPRDVAHIDADVPAPIKERFRKLAVWRLRFPAVRPQRTVRFKRARIDEPELRETEDEIIFAMPR